MKKTLVLTEVFYPEDFIINDLVGSWAEGGMDIEVLTRIPSYPKGLAYEGFKNKLFQKSEFRGVKVNHIPFVRGYQKSGVKKIINYINFAFFSFWFLLYNGFKYDRIFIYQTGPLSNAFSATFLKRFYGWKIIIWTQDLWPETVYAYGIEENKLNRVLLNWLVRFIYKRCDEIFVSCKGFIPKINNHVRNRLITWLPNWTLINGLGSSPLVLKGDFNFSFAGNIGKVQNIENVMIAFGAVAEIFPNVYFNIIGDGSNLENIKTLVRKEKIRNVVFHGRKEVKLMPDYFAASDVLVLSLVDSPVYEITIPSKFQAYLAARKPIFSIVSGELNALVEEFNIGFTAHPGSIESITKGFMRFVALTNKEINILALNSGTLESLFFSKTKIIQEITKKTFNN